MWNFKEYAFSPSIYITHERPYRSTTCSYSLHFLLLFVKFYVACYIINLNWFPPISRNCLLFVQTSSVSFHLLYLQSVHVASPPPPQLDSAIYEQTSSVIYCDLCKLISETYKSLYYASLFIFHLGLLSLCELTLDNAFIYTYNLPRQTGLSHSTVAATYPPPPPTIPHPSNLNAHKNKHTNKSN